jgi:Uncharacterized alpha/beta hydrolase domain (DUF2235)
VVARPTYWPLFVGLAIAGTLVALAAHVWTRVRWEWGLPGAPRWGFHLTEARMRFYDTDLNPKVAFARHAISIDERRASFEHVTWGAPRQWKASTPPWFEQVWFAGNHSDIGGSYPEEESRLSDVALAWMLDAAVGAGLKHDPALLRLYPDPAGPQHDEARSSLFRFAAKNGRKPRNDAPLHPTVLERFALAAVLNYDRMEYYRPPCLREHSKVAHFYALDQSVADYGEEAATEAERRRNEAHGRGDAKAEAHWERVRDALAQGSQTVVVPSSPLVAANES